MTTLAIKDLAVSKELDRKAMAGVSGGMGGGLILVDLSTYLHSDNKFAEANSTALAFTGPQSNVQNAAVYNGQVGGKGAFNLNVSPIHQTASNSAYADASSWPSITQGYSYYI